MTVWYNSYNNKFLSDRAHEEYFNNLVKSYNTDDNFVVSQRKLFSHRAI